MFCVLYVFAFCHSCICCIIFGMCCCQWHKK